MDWTQVRMVTTLLVGQTRVFETVGLEEARDFLARGLELGPYVDPTGWRKHHRSMEAGLRMVKAALVFVAEVKAALNDELAQPSAPENR